ncbi:hypothetical protein [Nocardioides sp.]|uniref:hypothetical protein n=1 Tax=Nocardioides sp. TaxID=35761 RepID=UPI002B279FD6|nr:hypothetical protein [Nocardioides sp.]
MVTRDDLADHVAHFQHRVIQEALNSATQIYFLRRAEEFEWAKPRLDDYHGQASNSELSRQWQRAQEAAQACRNRAAVALIQDEDPDVVVQVLAETWGPSEPRLRVVA